MEAFMNRATRFAVACAVLLAGVFGASAAAAAAAGAEKPAAQKDKRSTYKQDEILKETEAFFGKGAKGLAEVIAKALKEQGEPNGYIKGEEGGGAIGEGLRYGRGMLQMHGGATQKVYWQGPSIGFDIGGNAAKTFILVYKLNDTEKLFQRYPGVEGSLYFVGGFGLRYLRTDGITLAPVQLGVGWRQGANVGYMHFTKKKRINPF
jgi:hypothetical protein